LNIDIHVDEFKRDLALAVGDEFVAEKVMPYDLAEFCDASHLPLRQVATSLKNLCTATLAVSGIFH
jgi:serine/threonine-protein kinase HipA